MRWTRQTKMVVESAFGGLREFPLSLALFLFFFTFIDTRIS